MQLRVVLLISDYRYKHVISEIIKKCFKNSEVFIITDKKIVRKLTKILDKNIIRNVNIIVLEHSTEENALRIFSLTSPDILIDCDPHNYFEEIKRIIKVSHAIVKKCVLE